MKLRRLGLVLRRAERKYSPQEVLSLLDADVSRWFSKKFPSLTLPQLMGIPHIAAGEHVLISAPTGSGKTLAAFAYIISELFKLAKRGELEDNVYCVYVSPLRALNNDVNKNLLVPLREIGEATGIDCVRVAVRTGDTTPSERARMLKEPPHILITTPETLAIVLNAPKFRARLASTRWVIVDEIHDLCESKRGVHLSLSLERLVELCEREFQRIGLSATINPLEEVARFLVGNRDATCTIVDARFAKPMELKVVVPVPDLVHTPAQKATRAMYEFLKEVIRKHRTTLIFTNTRSGTERVVYHLKELGVVSEEELGAHHSSLSSSVRRGVEDMLKEGKLKAVVTSTSLELGIDIGYIDAVVQIGSPKSISRGVQRVGRSGHSVDRAAKGYFVALELDDLVEDFVLVRQARRGVLDKVRIPRNCLDVLAQHLFGMAIERKWRVEEAYEVVKRSYCYSDLPFDEFLSVLRFLSGRIEGLEEKGVYGKIWLDEEEGVFGRRGKLARAIYSENIGTIPENIAIKVYCGRWFVGTLEEEFVEKLLPGDVFVLGGRLFRFKRAKGLRVYVEPVKDVKPTVPAWFSELLPLSFELGEAISDFREEVWRLLAEGREEEARRRIAEEADEDVANAIIEYFKLQWSFLKAHGFEEFHSRRNLIVEHYVDEHGRSNLIFHFVFGRRANDALSKAYGWVLGKRLKSSFGLIIGDNGFVITFPREVDVGLEDLLEAKADSLRDVLEKASARSELARLRFRHVATRFMAILRRYKGEEVRLSKQQRRSEALFSFAKKYGLPVYRETMREIIEDHMDVANAASVLGDIEGGRRRIILLPKSDFPSPFSYDLILSGLKDVILMEDRRALLQRLYDEAVARYASRHAEATT